MLQIFIKGQQVDLLGDTEVAITIEQPMLSNDHIPVPYSVDIDLPLTAKNRIIFGFVDRPGRSSPFESMPAKIFFDGLQITSGEIKVTEIEETITINYNGVIIPSNIDKMAYKQSLGKVDFGTDAAKVNCNKYFIERTEEEFPDIIAAPVSIASRKEWEVQDGNHKTQFASSVWLNGYDAMDGQYLPNQYRRDSYINKILPAFRVGWLFNVLLDGRCQNNIFDSGDWKRLMILSQWHPKYKSEGNSPVWDVDPEGNASITLADFLPGIAANEIITELLKLPCASIYSFGQTFTVELNKDILSRNATVDWTKKVVGRISISEQEAQRYVAGFSKEDQEVASDLEIRDAKNILEICSLHPTSELDPATFRIANTGQIIQRMSADDLTGIDFKVLQQSMSSKEKDDPDDDRSDCDMSFGGEVVTTNIGLLKSTDDPAQGHRWYYVPQISEAATERPDNLLVGLYYGMCREIRWGAKEFYNYPYITHCNYDCRGNKLGDLSLSYLLSEGLMSYHQDFKNFMERSHRIVKCKVLLNAIDLHNLDMRDKVIYKNRCYYIKSITMTLHPHSIDPSDVELIEI